MPGGRRNWSPAFPGWEEFQPGFRVVGRGQSEIVGQQSNLWCKARHLARRHHLADMWIERSAVRSAADRAVRLVNTQEPRLLSRLATVVIGLL